MPHHHHAADRRLGLAVGLNLAIVIAEVIGGIASGSLALLSDAGHNLSDVMALALALFARRLGRRPPSTRHTFGFRRAEVLAALLNAATLLVVVTLIVREAVDRLQDPQPIQGTLMLTVAVVGLVANLVSVVLLHRDAHAHDINMRAAFVHLLQDTLSSVVVVAAALLAEWRHGPVLDPIASIVVAVAVLHAGWELLRDATHILMEATPRDLDLEEIRRTCEASTDITCLHHVHAWETGAGERMLTAHVRMDDRPLSDARRILDGLRTLLETRWGIQHVTLEVEPGPAAGHALVGEDCHQSGVRSALPTPEPDPSEGGTGAPL